MASTCYFDSSVLLWDDSIAAWDEDKCYQDITLFSEPFSNITFYSKVNRNTLFDITSQSSVSLINSNFLYNLLDEVNAVSDTLHKLSLIQSININSNSVSIYDLLYKNIMYNKFTYNGLSEVSFASKVIRSFVQKITSQSSVSLINSNFLYTLISNIYGSFETFIEIKLNYNFKVNVHATSFVNRFFANIPETYTQSLKPLNVYKFKYDNLSSTLMNTEMTNIYKWLNGVYNGELNYGGVYKWKFNETLTSLDLIFKDKVIMRIDTFGNLKLKGTLYENQTLE